MKKAIFLFVFLTMLTDSVNAQIQSFWGLKLGMTKNQVESTLNTQGKKWKVLDNGKFFVYKPTFNGIEFTILKLTFKTNKLESGIFEMDFNPCGNPNAPVFLETGSHVAKHKQLYRKFKSDFTAKYGQPIISSEDGDDYNCIWTKTNSINLTYHYHDLSHDDWWGEIQSLLSIEYRIVNNDY